MKACYQVQARREEENQKDRLSWTAREKDSLKKRSVDQLWEMLLIFWNPSLFNFSLDLNMYQMATWTSEAKMNCAIFL